MNYLLALFYIIVPEKNYCFCILVSQIAVWTASQWSERDFWYYIYGFIQQKCNFKISLFANILKGGNPKEPDWGFFQASNDKTKVHCKRYHGLVSKKTDRCRTHLKNVQHLDQYLRHLFLLIGLPSPLTRMNSCNRFLWKLRSIQ